MKTQAGMYVGADGTYIPPKYVHITIVLHRKRTLHITYYAELLIGQARLLIHVNIKYSLYF